jgi:hypothetical protein
MPSKRYFNASLQTRPLARFTSNSTYGTEKKVLSHPPPSPLLSWLSRSRPYLVSWQRIMASVCFHQKLRFHNFNCILEDGSLPGRSAVWTGTSLPTFQRSVQNHRPDDGGSTDLWNTGKLTPVYTALQPRRQPSSQSPQWEPLVIPVSLSRQWFLHVTQIRW